MHKNIDFHPEDKMVMEALNNDRIDLSDVALLVRVHREVTKAFPELRKGRAYPLRTLYSEDLWLDMDSRQRRLAEGYVWRHFYNSAFGLYGAWSDDGEEKLFQVI